MTRLEKILKALESWKRTGRVRGWTVQPGYVGVIVKGKGTILLTY
jgi:hypothetical protein